MSSQFTWWRRFYSTVKLEPKDFYKGASRLLQRIEFGEFEFNSLGIEVKLEDLIFEKQVEEMKLENINNSQDLVDQLYTDLRKKKNKRVDTIMKTHLEAEQKTLIDLKNELSYEFSLNKDNVKDIFETFDGTTRQLYFTLKRISEGRELLTNQEIDKLPRLFQPQPRHGLKRKHAKYLPLWLKILKEYNPQNAYQY